MRSHKELKLTVSLEQVFEHSGCARGGDIFRCGGECQHLGSAKHFAGGRLQDAPALLYVLLLRAISLVIEMISFGTL